MIKLTSLVDEELCRRLITAHLVVRNALVDTLIIPDKSEDTQFVGGNLHKKVVFFIFWQ